MLRALSFVCGLAWSVAALGAADRSLTPEEALKSFRLEPGLRIELVAAEPTVVAPVAMAFDEQGRMFVVENRGYPTNAHPAKGGRPFGRRGWQRIIREAHRVCGRSHLSNGVMPWKGGVIVTCAPDVLFLQDTNHDGRADTREVLFTGFDASNTTQLRVSHPR
jgi:hypothetical protein